MTGRKKPSAGFWITVALLAVLVGYPLSFGPACWISRRLQPSGEFVSTAYCPILLMWYRGPKWLGDLISDYAALDGGPTELTGSGSAWIKFR